MLSLSIRLRVFPTFGVVTLTTDLGLGGVGWELSDVGYQSSFSNTAPQAGEVSSPRVFWGWIFSGLYVMALPK